MDEFKAEVTEEKNRPEPASRPIKIMQDIASSDPKVIQIDYFQNVSRKAEFIVPGLFFTSKFYHHHFSAKCNTDKSSHLRFVGK